MDSLKEGEEDLFYKALRRVEMAGTFAAFTATFKGIKNAVPYSKWD
jgi:hypothetical protein